MVNLSDESLRQQLEAFGEDVGPLTNTTRPYWKKALSKLKSKHPGKGDAKNKNKKKSTRLSENRNQTSISEAGNSSRDEDLHISISDYDSYRPDSPGSTPFPKVTKKRNLTTKLPQIQHRDKELRDKLQVFGVRMDRGPMNEATRKQWQSKLDRLMFEATCSGTSSEGFPYQNDGPSFERWTSEEESPMQVARMDFSDETTPVRRRMEFHNPARYPEFYWNYDAQYLEKEVGFQNVLTTAMKYFSGCLRSIVGYLLKAIVCIVVAIGIVISLQNTFDKEVDVNPDKTLLQ